MEQSTLAIIILIAVIISYATEIIPLAMTSILGALLMALLGIIGYSDAFSGFGSDTVMLVIGMVIIGNAQFETGLAQTLGEVIVEKVGNNEKLFLFVIMVLASLFSGFMSNTATVAMLMPIIATAAQKSNGKITKKNTFMALGFAAVAGGNITLVGSTPQLVAQGILLESGIRGLEFFELARGAVPIVIVILIFFMTFGYSLQKRVFNFEDKVDEKLGMKLEEVSRFDPVEYSKAKMFLSGGVLILCLIGFIINIWSIGTIALLGAIILICTKCISEKVAFQKMDWSAVVILGGALGFSKGLEASGAGRLIADTVLGWCGGESASIILLFCAIVLVAVLLGNVMSHTATAAMMTPIAIYIAQGMNVDPITFVIGIVIGANLAFATPIGTTPITLTLVAGYRFNDYVKVGGIVTILCYLTLIALAPLLYGF